MTGDSRARSVLFHRLARNEYLNARRRYAREGGESVAARFTLEIDAAVTRIANRPDHWPRFRDDYRWARLHRYPYLLYYRIVDDNRVLVMACAHARRRPGYWLRRAKMP